jgi:serine/threonine protein kinase
MVRAVWLAPEVMANKIYTEKADVYSIGVILWELLTREPFFGHVRFMSRLEDMVLAGQRPPIPDDCPPAYRSLIEACWAQQPGTVPHPCVLCVRTRSHTRADHTRNRTRTHNRTRTRNRTLTIMRADDRPACTEIVQRVEAIMAEECPQARDYDALVAARHHAQREAEARARRTAALACQRERSSTTPTLSARRKDVRSLPKARPPLHNSSFIILTNLAKMMKLIILEICRATRSHPTNRKRL